MKVKIKKLDEKAVVPSYASAGAAGADLYAVESKIVPAGQVVRFGTGISVELPSGTVGLVFARSGLATKRNLAPANKVGVVDSDYRGEIIVALHNFGAADEEIVAGERIAQLVIMPYYTAEFEISDELGVTARGEGGFGSTGK